MEYQVTVSDFRRATYYGLLLVIPGAVTDIAGIALIAVVFVLTKLTQKKAAV